MLSRANSEKFWELNLIKQLYRQHIVVDCVKHIYNLYAYILRCLTIYLFNLVHTVLLRILFQRNCMYMSWFHLCIDHLRIRSQYNRRCLSIVVTHDISFMLYDTLILGFMTYDHSLYLHLNDKYNVNIYLIYCYGIYIHIYKFITIYRYKPTYLKHML